MATVSVKRSIAYICEKMVVMTIVNVIQDQEKAGRYMLFSSSISVLVIHFTQIKGGSSLQNTTLHSLGLAGKRVVIRYLTQL